MARHRLAALALPLAALLAACSSDEGPCDAVTSSFAILNVSTLEEASTFGPDELVGFKAVVKNDSTLPVTLRWEETCTPVYFEVQDDSGAVVFQGPCPPGHLCACGPNTMTLAPSEEYVVPGGWNQKLPGNLVDAPGGSYTVRSVDTSQCAPALDDAGDFTLTR